MFCSVQFIIVLKFHYKHPLYIQIINKEQQMQIMKNASYNRNRNNKGVYGEEFLKGGALSVDKLIFERALPDVFKCR